MNTKCWILSRPETFAEVAEVVEGAAEEEVDEPGVVVVAPPLEVDGETEVLEDAVVVLTPEEQAPTRKRSPRARDPQPARARTEAPRPGSRPARGPSEPSRTRLSTFLDISRPL